MSLFSIITPNYNSAEKLRRTIDSVIDQAGDFEYIIVDGNSTDASVGIARAAAAGNPEKIRFISEPDRNVYDAMNKGIRMATGRYVYFLGSGDTLFPGVLETLERHLPQHDLGFIYGDVIYKGARYDGPFDRAKLCGHNICHQAIFFGREVFKLCGEFDIEYARMADWAMNLRCFGHRLVAREYFDIVIAEFEEGGISGLGDERFERDKLRLVRQHLGMSLYLKLKLPLIRHWARYKVEALLGMNPRAKTDSFKC